MKCTKDLLILLLPLFLFIGLTACNNDSDSATRGQYVGRDITDLESTDDNLASEDEIDLALTVRPELASPDDLEDAVAEEQNGEDSAQVTVEDLEEADDNTTFGGTADGITGALHRIEYGNNVVYLFGTLHFYRHGWTPFAPVVEDAIQRADVFVTEIDHGEMAIMEAALPTVMFLTDGHAWASFLPEEAYNHLVATVTAWGTNHEMINTWHPTFLISSFELQQAMVLEASRAAETGASLTLDTSIDTHIMNIAAERGSPHIGLESAGQQLELLYTPPLEVVVAQVMAFGTPAETSERMNDLGTLSDMAQWYETNNFQAFQDQFARAIQDETPERLDITYMREKLANYRSTYYARQIAELLRETAEPTTFFVAVGISHIVRARNGVEGVTDIVEQLYLLGIRAEPHWD